MTLEQIRAIEGVTPEQVARAEKALNSKAPRKTKLASLESAEEVLAHINKMLANDAKPKATKSGKRVQFKAGERDKIWAVIKKIKKSGISVDEIIKALNDTLQAKVNKDKDDEIAKLQARIAALEAEKLY